VRRMQQQRASRYRLLHEFYRGEEDFLDDFNRVIADGLRSVSISSGSSILGKKLKELELEGVIVSSLVRQGLRESEPLDLVIEEDDVVVLFGTPGNLDRVERMLIGKGK
jgi:CPA2 family monovalent cation:H+ antiporter-2